MDIDNCMLCHTKRQTAFVYQHSNLVVNCCLMQGKNTVWFIGSNGMEPFELSLNQLNFQTYDLGENSTDQEPLHPFSNLVSYYWDLKSSEGDGAPVRAKKVRYKGLTG